MIDREGTIHGKSVFFWSWMFSFSWISGASWLCYVTQTLKRSCWFANCSSQMRFSTWMYFIAYQVLGSDLFSSASAQISALSTVNIRISYGCQVMNSFVFVDAYLFDLARVILLSVRLSAHTNKNQVHKCAQVVSHALTKNVRNKTKLSADLKVVDIFQCCKTQKTCRRLRPEKLTTNKTDLQPTTGNSALPTPGWYYRWMWYRFCWFRQSYVAFEICVLFGKRTYKFDDFQMQRWSMLKAIRGACSCWCGYEYRFLYRSWMTIFLRMDSKLIEFSSVCVARLMLVWRSSLPTQRNFSWKIGYLKGNLQNNTFYAQHVDAFHQINFKGRILWV